MLNRGEIARSIVVLKTGETLLEIALGVEAVGELHFDGYGKCWYLKIYDHNKVLLRDLVPCKNSNNIVGMYDIVNDVFYTNAGTDNFIGGPEVQLLKNISFKEVKTISRVPNEYIEVDYIESDGTNTYKNNGKII